MRNLYHRLNASVTARPTENDQSARCRLLSRCFDDEPRTAFFNEMLPEGEMKPDYWYRLFWTTAGPGKGVVLPLRHAVDGETHDLTTPVDLVPPMVYVGSPDSGDYGAAHVDRTALDDRRAPRLAALQ
jgi:hypothetical protein